MNFEHFSANEVINFGQSSLMVRTLRIKPNFLRVLPLVFYRGHKKGAAITVIAPACDKFKRFIAPTVKFDFGHISITSPDG